MKTLEETLLNYYKENLGFTVLITEADERSGYRVGNAYFFNHATNLVFLFLD